MTFNRHMFDQLKGKSLLIAGFGREGRSSFRTLTQLFPDARIAIADQRPLDKNQIEAEYNFRPQLFCGSNYLKTAWQFDLILKSPGIPSTHLGNIPKAQITSQTELILQHLGQQITGITGTKGKSTTSSLIYHLFKQENENCLLMGNIGIPPFDCLAHIRPDTRIVMELSAHQLENSAYSPHCAILLNLYEEHLDHFSSLEKYQQAKWNIAKHQQPNDLLILPAQDNTIQNWQDRYPNKSKTIRFGSSCMLPPCIYLDQQQVLFQPQVTSNTPIHLKHFTLPGKHNALNALAAIAAARFGKLSPDLIQSGLNSFRGLEHRLEFVGEYQQIHFYNDSIATIPEATIRALETLTDVHTLILGGFDRGINYDQLVKYLEHEPIKNIVLMGPAGIRIQQLLNRNPNCKSHFVDSIKAAVKYAKAHTPAGKACLLSPAAASYDCYKNFEERGQDYKKEVRQ